MSSTISKCVFYIVWFGHFWASCLDNDDAITVYMWRIQSCSYLRHKFTFNFLFLFINKVNLGWLIACEFLLSLIHRNSMSCSPVTSKQHINHAEIFPLLIDVEVAWFSFTGKMCIGLFIERREIDAKISDYMILKMILSQI